MITADPAAMTEVERLDELAELLARGAMRWFAAKRKARSDTAAARNVEIRQNRLDAVAVAEAPCGSRVQSPQSKRPA